MLLPTYTEIPEGRVYWIHMDEGFQSRFWGSNPGPNPLPSLEVIKDQLQPAKVTELAFFRSGQKGLAFEQMKHYDGMSDNLNHNDNSNAIYLLWKTVVPRPV